MQVKRILLVDDYPDALEVWSLYLRSRGYDVVTELAEISGHKIADGCVIIDYQNRVACRTLFLRVRHSLRGGGSADDVNGVGCHSGGKFDDKG